MFLAAMTATGCYAKISGNLKVDGAPFVAKSCRSGEAFGFVGIELADMKGQRLRLSAGDHPAPWSRPDNPSPPVPIAAFSSSDNVAWSDVGPCGALTVTDQRSKVMYRNIEGTATLACESAQHKISGDLQFENCH